MPWFGTSIPSTGVLFKDAMVQIEAADRTVIPKKKAVLATVPSMVMDALSDRASFFKFMKVFWLSAGFEVRIASPGLWGKY